MRLPMDWNGRFFHQGNGGIDGTVVPATGRPAAAPSPARCCRASRCSAPTPATPARSGPTFGIDPQARLDYGYQAVAKLTPMAKR